MLFYFHYYDFPAAQHITQFMDLAPPPSAFLAAKAQAYD